MSKLILHEQAAPDTPAIGKAIIYVKTDGKPYIKDDAGTETDLTAGGSGESNTASNVGTGEGDVFKQKAGVDLELRTLLAGDGIEIVTGTDEITITSTVSGGGSGETNLGANVGTGEGEVFRDKTGATLNFKTLKAGSNVSIANNADDVTITATVSGSGATTLDELSDVEITSVADNEVLAYDNGSGDWINQTAAEAGLAAASHTHAGSDVTSGTIAHERGGLEADVSAYAGLVSITGGATASVDTKAELESIISDVADFAMADGDVYTGVHDFGGATSLEIPNDAAPTVNANGELALDTTVTDFSHGILKYFGGEEMAVVAMPVAELTSPVDGTVVGYDAAADEFVLMTVSGAGATTLDGLSDVVITTPADNEVLAFDNGSGDWINQTASEAGLYGVGGTDVALADGGTGTSLSDPGADRILFWDESGNVIGWLVPNTGLSISTTNLNVNLSDTSTAGIVEIATAAEIDGRDSTGGTGAFPVMTADQFAQSNMGMRVMTIQVVDPNTVLTTGDGKAEFRLPAELNGYNLFGVGMGVNGPSSSGTPTVMISRGRQANATTAPAFVDMLSTALTIDVNEYDSKDATTPAVINISNDDILTGDRIRIDVDVAGTGTDGLLITLTFINAN